AGPPAGGVGAQPRALREPKFRLVGTDTDHDVAAYPVRTADPADCHQHWYYLTSPVSRRSIRTCPLPARELITVRSARAVRPPRPMTLPRSSGCTRTSSTLPRRSIRLTTRTSSGYATMPLTRCSRASSSMLGLSCLGRSGLGGRRLRRRGLLGRRGWLGR